MAPESQSALRISHAFVTGAGGFIGSNLVDHLLAANIRVTGYDNFSTGLEEFLDTALESPQFRLVRGDLLNADALAAAMAGTDFVFHFAANADVRFGTDHPRKDLEQNTIATFNVLEAMRANSIRRIAFSSTGSVYGEATVIPTPEDAPFPVQTSLYGASKLAGEALISAYAEGFGFQGIVFRFVSILGERYTHGHVFDFVRRLRADPTTLHILGDGRQRKSYLHVDDCVAAILVAVEKSIDRFQIYNLGTDEYCAVNDSVAWISQALGVSPTLTYSGGDRGWIGDNPFIFLDTARIRRFGWRPRLTISGRRAADGGLFRTQQLVVGPEAVMRVCVAGLWHLGSVTSACLAAGGHTVVGFDDDSSIVASLGEGKPPLFEPGLADLVSSGLATNRLAFTRDPRQAVERAEVYWVAYDTPVNENNSADVGYVVERVQRVLPLLPDRCLVLISSQLPVGSTRALAHHFRNLGTGRRVGFGCSPENLRLGNAVEVFSNPDRVIVGLELDDDRSKVAALLQPFTTNIVFMSVESSEMTKHAINSFLATSVAFANEIAVVCEFVGADADDVARGLRTDSRIGPRAYVAPGVAFSGGTLARDIMFLTDLGRSLNIPLSLIPSVNDSNRHHRAWPYNRLSALLDGLKGRRIALLGLTYKPGTDTLRRSSALDLARMMLAAGAEVCAFDPVISQWPPGFELPITLCKSAAEAVRGADGAVIMTEWPEFCDLDWSALVATMAKPILIDPNGHVSAQRSRFGAITYAVVGRLSGPPRRGDTST